MHRRDVRLWAITMFEHIDPTIREWLYAREMMRRLGFAPDEIFFVVNPPGKQIIENGILLYTDKVFIVLRVQSQGLDFNWTIGPTDVPDSQIESHFERAINAWNSADNSPELDFAFTSSRPFSQAVGLMNALHAKGFVLRRWN